MQRSNNVYPIERIISSLSYFTTGMVGFIWLIIAFCLKKRVTPFLMYHIMQSIFLGIAFYLLYAFVDLISVIPILNNISLVLKQPFSLFYGLSFLQILTGSLSIYLIISSFWGYYSYVPVVSDIINSNLDNRN